jgi:hypothetical protein
MTASCRNIRARINIHSFVPDRSDLICFELQRTQLIDKIIVLIFYFSDGRQKHASIFSVTSHKRPLPQRVHFRSTFRELITTVLSYVVLRLTAKSEKCCNSPRSKLRRFTTDVMMFELQRRVSSRLYVAF